jgi:hypothetical protein
MAVTEVNIRTDSNKQANTRMENVKQTCDRMTPHGNGKDEEMGTLIGPAMGVRTFRGVAKLGVPYTQAPCKRYEDDGIAWGSLITASCCCPCVCPCCCAFPGGLFRKKRCVESPVRTGRTVAVPQVMQRDVVVAPPPVREKHWCVQCVECCCQFAAN